MGCKRCMDPRQVENRRDLRQVIFGNNLLKTKRIQQLTLIVRPSWTAPANHRLNPTESRFVGRLDESFATQSPEADIARRCRRLLHDAVIRRCRLNVRFARADLDPRSCDVAKTTWSAAKASAGSN
jgi:hypothetical protein